MTCCGLNLDVLRNALCGGGIMSIQQGSEKFQAIEFNGSGTREEAIIER
jgi:hypothetical protein